MAASILFSLSVLFAIWGIYSLLGHRSAKRDWKNRVEKWYGTRQARKSFIVLLGDRFDKTSHAQKISRQLLQANIPLMASEFYGILFVGAMATAIVLHNFSKIGIFPSAILAILAMTGVRYLVFILRKNKFKERMNEQLPEVCRILANATRSGMTLTQGIDLAAKELDAPAQEEFQRMANELHLGVDFEQALRAMEQRVSSREFKLFVATLLIQKRAGGNLHAVLDEMGQTLDDRKVLLQEVKTMTAEQRYIAYIVPVVPVLLIFLMNNIIDGFIDPLFTGIGAVLGILFLIGTVLTFFLIKKVTTIRM